jgi:DNA mismatch repair protein MutL
MGTIRILEDSVARKIAAGEVIDRPLSVVRELLDNAIDAGSTEITCHVEGGGIRRIRISDNGSGMSRDDLELSIMPHATSKITEEDDLFRLTTLGFRGEALASIATCSRLEIQTSKGDEGWKLTVHGGRVLSMEPTAARPGTIVDASDLFWSMPARRKFLKRNSTESQLCRKHFIEKSLPFNGIVFRYFNDDAMELFLPVSDRKERFMAAYPGEMLPGQLLSDRREHEGLSVELVAGLPELHKKNRSLIQIYVNNRRIDEYSLMQSVQYAYTPFLPGGLFPVCAVFLEIPPEEVDFNVHPAKREARFRDLQGIHHFLTVSLQSLLSGQRSQVEPVKQIVSGSLWGERNLNVMVQPVYRENGNAGMPQWAADKGRFESLPLVEMSGGRYLGQVFRCFLLAEKGDSLYMIDQHAAHERILYNRLIDNPPTPQNLLIPDPVQWETDEESLFVDFLPEIERAGFRFEKKGEGVWDVVALPSVLSGSTEKALLLLRESLADTENLSRELYSRMACRAAVKEGDVLDEMTARNLVQGAFALAEPRCPHGRPVWFRLTQGELEGLVGRVIT